MPATVTPILQFGTSRFLQAHADLFFSEARKAGQDCGPVTVVQTTRDAARARRLAALSAPEGFPVRVRGLSGGALIDREVRVTSIRRTLSVADWAEVTRIAVEEAEILLSNTGDTGFQPQPTDSGPFDPAMSYPAKLLTLLEARHAAGGQSLQILPTELVSANGEVLRDRVLVLAEGRSAAFRDWLRGGVIWGNSLVDRIASEPLEPAGAVAEPYALWAIARQPGLVAPCLHPAVQIVEDLARVEALKLFILNLGHTVMAESWLKAPEAVPLLVRDWLADAALSARLREIYATEVLPGFAAAGFGAEAQAYVATTLERFANPFLDHRISDIAQNHAQKIGRRIRAFLHWAEAAGDRGAKPVLRGIAAG